MASHFTNFIFSNDDGTPVVFSKNGNTGPYVMGAATDFQVSVYGNITGYYRKKKE
jgi:hypothetical protein